MNRVYSFPTCFFQAYCNITYTSHFQAASLLQASHQNGVWFFFSSVGATCSTHLIILDLLLLRIFVMITYDEAPHYAFSPFPSYFLNPQLIHTFSSLTSLKYPRFISCISVRGHIRAWKTLSLPIIVNHFSLNMSSVSCLTVKMCTTYCVLHLKRIFSFFPCDLHPSTCQEPGTEVPVTKTVSLYCLTSPRLIT
jgi:hypothetical protein